MTEEREVEKREKRMIEFMLLVCRTKVSWSYTEAISTMRSFAFVLQLLYKESEK
jgi:hypothetical protein